jgi:hypothetical protein
MFSTHKGIRAAVTGVTASLHNFCLIQKKTVGMHKYPKYQCNGKEGQYHKHAQ